MVFKKQQQQVEIHVPRTDPGEEVVKQADSWLNGARELLDERNRYKERAEWLLAQFDSAKQTIERLQLEHDHSYQVLGNERDFYRKAYTEMVCRCGELMTTIHGMFAMANNARATLSRVAALVEHMPVLEPEQQLAPAAPNYDGNGGAPEPDANELHSLAQKLAAAQ